MTLSQEPMQKSSTLQGEMFVNKESWVDQGNYLRLNVSYQLLAGAPSAHQSE